MDSSEKEKPAGAATPDGLQGENKMPNSVPGETRHDSPGNGAGGERKRSAWEQRKFEADYLRQTQGGELDQHGPWTGGGSTGSPGPDQNSELEDEYYYLDANGDHYLKVTKFRNEDGTKSFRQSHWVSKGVGWHWEPGKPDGPKIPYDLPLLIKAAPEIPVYICEGEKDSDNVSNLGIDIVSTCASEGAGKWTPDLNQWFKGRKQAFILQDNDEAGRKHAIKVATSLLPEVDEIRIVPFPELPPNGDVSDWLAMGHTKEDLIARCLAAPVFQRTTIEVRGGAVTEIVDTAERALVDNDCGIFQRDELVRAVRIDRQIGDEASSEVRRAKGAMMLIQVTQPWLLEQMGKHARWITTKILPPKRNDPEKKPRTEVRVMDPPDLYARTLMARKGEWRFPVLRAVITAPTMDATGRVIQQSGYDYRSGLLLDFEGGTYPVVPGNPTKADAIAALERFVHRPGGTPQGILRGFPFESEGAKSVALSALMGALLKPGVGSIPLHAFDAPTAGTGKTMLAVMPALLATGHKPTTMTQGKSPEEDEKRLSSVLRAGDQVILIDNCTIPIEGDFICLMLTEDPVTTRILGLSKMMILPSTALLMATGNNLIVAGDVSRRTVRCRLNAGMERPDTREFDFDARAELLADRPGFVVAALTAMRAFSLAEDKPKITPMGSFPDYDLIRGTLKWCGYADPVETQQSIMEDNPEKLTLAEVMEAWGDQFQDRAVTVADIRKLGHENALYRMLAEVCGEGGFNPSKVGRWLRRQKDRIIGGCAFRDVPEGFKWRLEGGRKTGM